jgi:hypothetical protein
MLYLAESLNYISPAMKSELLQKSEEIAKTLRGLAKSLNT